MEKKQNNSEVKMSWVEKVMAFVKISEPDRVSAMQKAMLKFYNDEIRKCNGQIENLQRELHNYLEDAEEGLAELISQEDEAFLNLNFDKIATKDDRKSYVAILDAQFNRAIQDRKKLEDEMKERQAKDEKAISDWEAKIELLEYKKGKIA